MKNLHGESISYEQLRRDAEITASRIYVFLDEEATVEVLQGLRAKSEKLVLLLDQLIALKKGEE